mmetsp:Transcript_31291/g.82132  ORF Transcript_31291/g.82132 Transcript_31291/m.82132 type:complete len:228 (-) Transcript_31291:553-1236(-)
MHSIALPSAVCFRSSGSVTACSWSAGSSGGAQSNVLFSFCRPFSVNLQPCSHSSSSRPSSFRATASSFSPSSPMPQPARFSSISWPSLGSSAASCTAPASPSCLPRRLRDTQDPNAGRTAARLARSFLPQGRVESEGCCRFTALTVGATTKNSSSYKSARISLSAGQPKSRASSWRRSFSGLGGAPRSSCALADIACQSPLSSSSLARARSNSWLYGFWIELIASSK